MGNTLLYIYSILLIFRQISSISTLLPIKSNTPKSRYDCRFVFFVGDADDKGWSLNDFDNVVKFCFFVVKVENEEVGSGFVQFFY